MNHQPINRPRRLHEFAPELLENIAQRSMEGSAYYRGPNPLTSLRLTCRSIAYALQPFFINTFFQERHFSFRDRHLQRLIEVGKYEAVAEKVKLLHIHWEIDQNVNNLINHLEHSTQDRVRQLVHRALRNYSNISEVSIHGPRGAIDPLGPVSYSFNRTMEILIDVLDRVGVELKELDLGIEPDERLNGINTLLDLHFLHHPRRCLRRLEKLQVGVLYDGTGEDDPSGAIEVRMPQDFASMLHNIPTLKTLVMYLSPAMTLEDDIAQSPLGSRCFSHISACLFLPALTNLELRYVVCEEQEMVELLRRHRRTLKSLSVCTVAFIQNGTLLGNYGKMLLEEIQINLIGLESLELSDLLCRDAIPIRCPELELLSMVDLADEDYVWVDVKTDHEVSAAGQEEIQMVVGKGLECVLNINPSW